MTGTGFSWAITQWAPFSLVRLHLSPSSLLQHHQFFPPQLEEELTFLTQLAEAILTEPDPALASIPDSIRLADTRTTTGDARDGDGEREVFLPGDLSDDGSDDASEDGKGGEGKPRVTSLEANGNRVMGNRGARVSRVEVSPTAVRDEDVHWEDDDIDDIDEPGRTESKPASLSSKAGSILVRVRPSCSTHDRHIYIYPGITQRIHRGTPIYCHRLVGHNVRHVRSCAGTKGWTDATTSPRPSACECRNERYKH